MEAKCRFEKIVHTKILEIFKKKFQNVPPENSSNVIRNKVKKNQPIWAIH